jgi:hypothetical protein
VTLSTRSSRFGGSGEDATTITHIAFARFESSDQSVGFPTTKVLENHKIMTHPTIKRTPCGRNGKRETDRKGKWDVFKSVAPSTINQWSINAAFRPTFLGRKRAAWTVTQNRNRITSRLPNPVIWLPCGKCENLSHRYLLADSIISER